MYVSILPELNVKYIDFGSGSGSWTVTATWLMNRTYMYVNEIVAGWMIRAILLVRALFVFSRNALPACSSTKDSSEKHRETWKPSPRNPFATEILPRFLILLPPTGSDSSTRIMLLERSSPPPSRGAKGRSEMISFASEDREGNFRTSHSFYVDLPRITGDYGLSSARLSYHTGRGTGVSSLLPLSWDGFRFSADAAGSPGWSRGCRQSRDGGVK